MSNPRDYLTPRSSGRSRAARALRGRSALAWLPLAFAFSCGVEEHPHPLTVDTNVGGSKFAPPPPPPATTTGGASTGGTAPGTGGTTPFGTGGAATAGGSTNTGGAANTGGVSTPGNGGSNGGVPSTSGGVVGGGAPSTGGASVASGGTATGGTATGGTATAGRSGITIDINGTVLPKEDVIAFVHLGHSNMAGRSARPTASRPYHFTDVNLRAWIYRAGSWTPALEPNTAGDADAKRFNQGGPGTSLLKEAVALAPTRYFVSLGYGIGSAYCTQFLPGSLYYDQVMAAPKALKGKVTFGAIVIMLGITERHSTAIGTYPECINTLVTAIRTDLAEPTMPLLLTDYEMGSTGAELSPTGTFAQQIIPQIRRVPTLVSNSALVPTDGIAMQDDHHFDLDGQKDFAKRVLSVMQTKGWIRW